MHLYLLLSILFINIFKLFSDLNFSYPMLSIYIFDVSSLWKKQFPRRGALTTVVCCSNICLMYITKKHVITIHLWKSYSNHSHVLINIPLIMEHYHIHVRHIVAMHNIFKISSLHILEGKRIRFLSLDLPVVDPKPQFGVWKNSQNKQLFL